MIAHVKFDSDKDFVTHIVIVEGPVRRSANGVSIPIIEAQGYDDKSTGRIGFTSSAEMTVRHDYVEEYMKTIARPNVPYIRKFYVVRAKPKP